MANPPRSDPPRGAVGMPERPVEQPDIAPEPDPCGGSGSSTGENVTIEVHNQAELDALRGCTAVPGNLYIYPFESVDLTALSELRAVGGTLIIGDARAGDGEAPPGFPSLVGLDSLRELGSLYLRGVLAPTLESLQGLRRLGIVPEWFGSLQIDDCPLLTDLRGLENLTGLHAFGAKNNPRLTSLAGLQIPSELVQFEIWNSPVADLAPLRGLTSVQHTLWFINTGLTSAAGLEQLRSVDQLQFTGNDGLFDLSGLSGVTSIGFMYIIENPALERLPDFPMLTEFGGFGVMDNPTLQEAPAWPGLTRAGSVSFARNPLLERVLSFSALEIAEEIHVDGNPTLLELELGRLQRADVLRVTHNASLDSALVPRPSGGNIIIGGNRGEAVGLDPCPWSPNGYCEGPPLDDLCALGADSDCPAP